MMDTFPGKVFVLEHEVGGESNTRIFATREDALAAMGGVVSRFIHEFPDAYREWCSENPDRFAAFLVGDYDATQTLFDYFTTDSGRLVVREMEVEGDYQPIDREAAMLADFIGYLNGWGYAIIDDAPSPVDILTAPDAATIIGDYLRLLHDDPEATEPGPSPSEEVIEEHFEYGVAFGEDARKGYDAASAEDRDGPNGGPVTSNGWTLEEIMRREW